MTTFQLDQPFKTCTKCGYTWSSVLSFLDDGRLKLNGYQADFQSPDRGLLLFTHGVEHCQSTLAVRVHSFQPWIEHTGHHTSFLNTESCSEYCLDETNLELCENPCKYQWVRLLIQSIRTYKAAQVK